MNNPKLTDVMKNITVDKGEHGCFNTWYTGTKEDLIKAGLAQEYMFAEYPKRNKYGWLDCNGNPIEDAHSNDKYDWYGETRPIWWDTKRIKGSRFVFAIEKSWEEKQRDRNPPLDRDMYQALIYILTGFHTKRFIDSAFGEIDDNPDHYQLSNAKEVEQAAIQLKSTILKGNIINTPRLSVI